MEKTTISGNWGGTNFNVSITSTVEGKAVGNFLADVYEQLLDRSPSLLDKFTKMVPGLYALAIKARKAIEKSTKMVPGLYARAIKARKAIKKSTKIKWNDL